MSCQTPLNSYFVNRTDGFETVSARYFWFKDGFILFYKEVGPDPHPFLAINSDRVIEVELHEQ